MAYTAIDDSESFFQCKTYTGSGNSQSITFDGTNDMQPDMCWVKDRERSGYNNILNDSVRGVTNYLRTNLINDDDTYTDAMTSFDSDGFTLGSDASNGEHNVSTETYVSWNWKAGTAFSNDASATGIGTIDSSGSVNDTAGFSIVIRTGTGSAGTIKHGLSTVPKMIWTKMRGPGSSDHESWGVYHISLGNTHYMKLDTNEAKDSSSGVWNNTTPTTSVFSVGSSALVNGSGKTYVDYVFSEVKGYSKIGKYEGNGNNNGPFNYTGFKPAFIITKTVDSTYHWSLNDNKRDTGNPSDNRLYPSQNAAEATSTNYHIDFLSNGFKIRSSHVAFNNNGDDVIYIAFAENPFVNSKGTPGTAR